MVLRTFALKLKHILANLNDQQWGRKDSDRPSPPRPPHGRIPDPELEALWRDVSNRLKGVFGKRGSDPGSGDGGQGKEGGGSGRYRGDRRFLWLGVALPLLWLGSGFFIVQEAQRAVVLTFGAATEIVGPGFHWRLPWPIQGDEIVNVSQIRSTEIGHRNNSRRKVPEESLMLTNDENIIDLQITVQYRLKDASDYLFSNVDTDETVKLSGETILREVVGRYKMDYVLSEGREQVANEVSDELQQLLDRYKTGILVSGVILQNAQPPEQVQSAFDDAVKAGQDRERQKNEGESYANDVIPKARGVANRMLEEAEGYKARIVGTARGDAERFNRIVVEYQKAPAVTRSRMYLETMQEVFSNVTKVMVESSKSNNLLYLPLDKIINNTGRSGPNAAPEPTPSSAVPVTPASPVVSDLRSREAR